MIKCINHGHILNFLFSGSGKYIYFETSTPVQSGNTAVLESQVIKAGSPPICLKFHYHMYGNGMGELKLETVSKDGTRTQLFQNTNSENAWKEQEITMATQDVDYHV